MTGEQEKSHGSSKSQAGSAPVPGAGLKTWLRKLGKPVWFVVAAVATLVIGYLWDAGCERRSRVDPLSIDVRMLLDANQPQQLGSIFMLVVPDPHRLPKVLPTKPPFPGDDCRELWRLGVNAGGEPPLSAKYKIILTGNVPSSEVAIVDMRAKITRRSPPSDGAFLMCGWGMGMEPDIPFKFDLTKSDTAPATIRDSSGQVQQFRDVSTIKVGEGEAVNIQFEARLPSDSIDWRVEADIVIGDDQPRTISIDDNGKEFHSLGLRHQYIYREYIWSGLPGLIDPGGWARDNTVQPRYIAGLAGIIEPPTDKTPPPATTSQSVPHP